MEITIGVQHVARELVVETDQTAEAVAKDLRKALETGAPIELTDTRGRRVIVPSSTVAYVEIGEEMRKVGFHTM